MEHIMYLTLAPAPEVEYDEGFAERNRLIDGVTEASFIHSIGGGTQFDPLEFDIDLVSDDGQGVLWAYHWLLESMAPDWSVKRMIVKPADQAEIEIPYDQPSFTLGVTPDLLALAEKVIDAIRTRAE